jgi:hypothetical protein
MKYKVLRAGLTNSQKRLVPTWPQPLEEDRSMLVQLKKIQVELASKIESQTEVVVIVSLERQKLQSLLDDNLMKRRQELLSLNVYSVSNYQKRSL